MNKVELEAKVDALMDEINFLKAFYEAVSRAHCAPSEGLEAGGLSGAQRLQAAALISSLLPTHPWVGIHGADATCPT